MNEFSLASALMRIDRACPAACTCAREYRTLEIHPAGDLSIAGYLAQVYPTAAARFLNMPPEESYRFFEGLHFYYDFGHLQCKTPSAVLRFLYSDFLPCSDFAQRHLPRALRQSANSCMAAHFHFAPQWATDAVNQGWAEVEHRAVGFLVKNADEILYRARNSTADAASAFMDSGSAGMWYLFRKGSGIFYQMGRTKAAPGKTAMMALLLQELSQLNSLSHEKTWHQIAERSGLFSSSAPSKSAAKDAERILAVANGSAHCNTNGISFCRCQSILHDLWDDAMVWAARILKYETLFFTATLLCHQQPNTTFTTAYPELVDVRPLQESWVQEQGRGVLSMLAWPPIAPSSDGLHQGMYQPIYTLRKKPRVADRWIDEIRARGLLSLRDPLFPSVPSHVRPCNFSVSKVSLQCANHISAEWPESEWHWCALPMCGYKGLWVGGARLTSTEQPNLLANRQLSDIKNNPANSSRSSQRSWDLKAGSEVSKVSSHHLSRIAICVGGLERTLLAVPVVRTFRDHVMIPLKNMGLTVDPYIVIINDTFPRAPEFKQLVVRAYAPKHVELVLTQPLPRFRCPLHGSHLAGSNGSVSFTGVEKRAQRHARSILVQWIGIRECYRQIEAHEQKEQMKYSFIFRTRSDIVYLEDIPLTSEILQKQDEVYVPMGGMSEKQEFQCMNDHMFLCPRALCRPYFELLELWESEFCVEQVNALEQENVVSRSIFAHTHANGHLEVQDKWSPPRSKFLLPIPPSRANAEWFFFARYTLQGKLCDHGESSAECCGLLRELRWRYAIARGSAVLGYIECRQRLLQFWRGNQQQLELDHHDVLVRCETLAQNWSQWQLLLRTELTNQSNIIHNNHPSSLYTIGLNGGENSSHHVVYGAPNALSKREIRALG